MPDVVDTIVLESTPRRYVARFTNVSDGTGESAVKKIDKSALVDFNGREPYRLIIDYIKWSIQGFTSVRGLFDATTDDEAFVLGTGTGERSYWPEGLKDPLSAGAVGDLLFTTAGTTSGNTYDIVVNCRLEPAK